MIRYLLDTHAAVWLLEGSSKLGDRARTAIEAEETIAMAGISLLEIALLTERGKLKLKPNLDTGLATFAEKLAILPLDARIATDAVGVGLPHRDPFDRVITATARVHEMTLVTKDSAIVSAAVVETIW